VPGAARGNALRVVRCIYTKKREERPWGRFGTLRLGAQPYSNERRPREAFSHAVPLKTLGYLAMDPRGSRDFPDTRATLFGDEGCFPGGDHSRTAAANRCRIVDHHLPGDLVRWPTGRRRAAAPFPRRPHRSGSRISSSVHHSGIAGADDLHADGIIQRYRHEHHLDLRTSTAKKSTHICITDYEAVGLAKHETGPGASH